MKKRKLITAAALVCTASMLAGTAMAAHPLTNAKFPWETEKTAVPAAAEEVVFGLPMLENAVHQYLGLDADEPLTADLLTGITSITFSLSDFNDLLRQTAYDGKTAVKIAFNHGALPGIAEHEDADYAYEAVPRVIRTEYFDLSAITDEWLYHKFASFYTVKDPADPLLEERGVAEMTARYPNTQAGSLMYLDPEAKPRELKELFTIADKFGLVNTDTFMEGNRIDVTGVPFEKFPDLLTVEFTGGLDCTGEWTKEAEFVVFVQGPGLIEEEDIPVEFESLLLENALREYFGLEEGQPLTQGMIEQVRRIDFCGSLWQEGLVKLEGYEDKTAVKCIINGGALTDAEGKDLLSFDLPLWDMFGGKQGMFGYEALPVMVRTSFVPFDSITDEWNRMKMKSFYVSKDITDPLLEPEAVDEMLTMYPILAADAFSILDPEAKPRELAALLDIGFAFGLVNEETIIDGTTVVLKMDDIVKLPTGTELYFDNLSVEYVN